MTVTFHAEYGPGHVVWLKLRDEDFPGMVTAVMFDGGSALYHVTWADTSTSRHYGCELAREFVPDYARTPNGGVAAEE